MLNFHGYWNKYEKNNLKEDRDVISVLITAIVSFISKYNKLFPICPPLASVLKGVALHTIVVILFCAEAIIDPRSLNLGGLTLHHTVSLRKNPPRDSGSPVRVGNMSTLFS